MGYEHRLSEQKLPPPPTRTHKSMSVAHTKTNEKILKDIPPPPLSPPPANSKHNNYHRNTAYKQTNSHSAHSNPTSVPASMPSAYGGTNFGTLMIETSDDTNAYTPIYDKQRSQTPKIQKAFASFT